jgi:hypothetical protein
MVAATMSERTRFMRSPAPTTAFVFVTLDDSVRVRQFGSTIAMSCDRAPAKRIETDPHQPQFIHTVHGDGYYCLTVAPRDWRPDSPSRPRR